jgi:hypothetical protein
MGFSYESLAVETVKWFLQGNPVPPPPVFKQAQLAAFVQASQYKRVFETGTLFGGTVQSLHKMPIEIDTIELFEPLYVDVKKRLGHITNARFHLGDSGVVLPQLLKDLKEPAVFWLDGHYSGEGTGQAGLDTPIIAELETIAAHPVKNHLVLIDDIRAFGQSKDYPTLKWVEDFAAKNFPGMTTLNQHDTFAIGPAAVLNRLSESAAAALAVYYS